MHHSQFARDPLGRWVNAFKTKRRRGVFFTCDCPDRHKMKLVKPLGLGKRTFRPYFARVPTYSDKSSSKRPTCCGNGESVEHRNAKHLLKALQGKFRFAVRRCRCCRTQTVETCKRGTIEIELVSKDGRWRYDCMLCVDNKPVLALEIVKTHFSSANKISSTRADGLGLAEFRAEDVLALEENDGGWLENLQVEVILCDPCLRKQVEKACIDAKIHAAYCIRERQRAFDRSCSLEWEQEIIQWKAWEQQIAKQYELEYAWYAYYERQRKAALEQDLEYMHSCLNAEIEQALKNERQIDENMDRFEPELRWARKKMEYKAMMAQKQRAKKRKGTAETAKLQQERSEFAKARRSEIETEQQAKASRRVFWWER